MLSRAAPSARHASRPGPATRADASNRGEQSGLGTGHRRLGSPGVSPLRGGSFARVLRTKALRTRRLPPTASRHRPQPVPP
jgi:hypothetical protein